MVEGNDDEKSVIVANKSSNTAVWYYAVWSANITAGSGANKSAGQQVQFANKCVVHLITLLQDARDQL